MDYLDRAAQWNQITGECVDPSNPWYREASPEYHYTLPASNPIPSAISGNAAPTVIPPVSSSGVSGSDIIVIATVAVSLAAACWQVYKARNAAHRIKAL